MKKSLRDEKLVLKSTENLLSVKSDPCSQFSMSYLGKRLLFLLLILVYSSELGIAQSIATQGNGRPNNLNTTANDQPNVELTQNDQLSLPESLDVERMLSPTGMSSTLKIMLLLTVLSLAPSILIMTTCFIRFVIVFGLLRQALGTQQLPPNQVIISLCLFLTFLVMAPVWQKAYHEGISPYTEGKPLIGLQPDEEPYERAFKNAVKPIRDFMSEQIEKANNSEAVWTFLKFQAPDSDPKSYDEVPLTVLLPAYMVSELKIAFVIGFQIYLPFLIIDMVVASILISMGMMMLPPILISLPFKLLLFILIDGWILTIGMLLNTVQYVH